MFTPFHERYEVKISHNEKSFTFEYQCPGIKKPKREELLECLIMDMKSYDNNKDIDSFQVEFGYEKVTDCMKAYIGCKEISGKMHSVFSETELEQLEQLFF